MLILTLKPGPEHELVIGEEVVVVTVLGVRGGQVRVGVSAPSDIMINRRKIYERIKAEREADKADGEVESKGEKSD